MISMMLHASLSTNCSITRSVRNKASYEPYQIMRIENSFLWNWFPREYFFFFKSSSILKVLLK